MELKAEDFTERSALIDLFAMGEDWGTGTFNVDDLSFKEKNLADPMYLLLTYKGSIEEPGKSSFLVKVDKKRTAWKLEGTDTYPGIMGMQPTKDAADENVRFLSKMRDVAHECFYYESDKTKVTWLIVGSNPFWRIWKSQIARPNSSASNRLLTSLQSLGKDQRKKIHRDMHNLGQITFTLMEKVNSCESMLELMNEEVSIDLALSKTVRVTLSFWKWSILCSQATTRCGLWKELTVQTGLYNLTMPSIRTVNPQEEDSYALCHMMTKVVKIECIPGSYHWDTNKGRERYDSLFGSDKPSSKTISNSQKQSETSNSNSKGENSEKIVDPSASN